MKKGDLIWGGVLALISLLLVIPSTHDAFISLTKAHAYVMSFIKFAILATMGELLAGRIVWREWRKPKGLTAKAVIWGFLGMAIGLAFSVFNGGAVHAVALGLLPGGSGWLAVFLTAFYTSAVMNVTFGPMMMALHRVTDTYVDRAADGMERNFTKTIAAVDWLGFINFVVLKTCPFFWIPAHTLVFLLPQEYRVLASAYLSIVLGGLLAYAKKKASAAPPAV